MPEYVGPIRLFEVSALPWLLSLVPLAGFLSLLGWGAREASEPSASNKLKALFVVAPVVQLISLMALVPAISAGSEVIAPGWRLFSVGSLSVAIGLGVDRPAWLLMAAVSVVVLARTLFSWSRFEGLNAEQLQQERLRVARWQAGLGLLSWAVMADGPVTWLGVAGVSLVLSVLHDIGCKDRKTGLGTWVERTGFAGVWFAVVTAGLLAWASHGAFAADGYSPFIRSSVIAIEPRADYLTLVARPAEKSVKPTGSAFLSMLGPTGATAYLGSDPRTAMAAPFSKMPVPAGPHAVRVTFGDGVDDSLVKTFRLDENAEVRLVAQAPSMTWRELVDARQIRSLVGEFGPRTGQLSSAVFLCLLAAFSGWLLSRDVRDGARVRSGEVGWRLVPAVMLGTAAMRMLPVFGELPLWWMTLPIALFLLLRALGVTAAMDARRALVDSALVLVGVGCIAALVGATSVLTASLIGAVMSAVTGDFALDLTERDWSARGVESSSSGVSLGGMANPTRLHALATGVLAPVGPALASFWIFGSTADVLLSHKVIPGWVSGLVAVVLLVIGALVSFGAFRAHHAWSSVEHAPAVLTGKNPKDAAKKQGAQAANETGSSLVRSATVLVTLTLIACVGLAAEPMIRLATGQSPIEQWLEPAYRLRGTVLYTPRSVILSVVVLLFSVLAWSRARVRYSETYSDNVAKIELSRPLVKILSGLGVLCLMLLAAGNAYADSGTIAGLSLINRGTTLVSGVGERFEGRFVLENTSDKHIDVKTSVLNSEQDLRLPVGFTVGIDRPSSGGSALVNAAPKELIPNFSIAPHSKRDVSIRWTRLAPKSNTAFGHAVIQTNEGSMLVPFFARPSGIRGVLIGSSSWLIWLVPMLGALAAMIGLRVGEKRERTARRIVLTTLGLTVLCVVWILKEMPLSAGRIDGSDGIQMPSWIDIGAMGHILLGFDGVGLALSISVLAAVALGVASMSGGKLGVGNSTSALVLSGAAVIVAALSFDIFTSIISVVLLSVFAFFGGKENQANTSGRFWFLLGGVLVAIGLGALLSFEKTPAANGVQIASIPELVRHSLLEAPAISGVARVAVIWSVFVAGAAFLMGLPAIVFSLNQGFKEWFEKAPMPTVVGAISLWPTVGAIVMLRWAVLVLPEATRWGANTLVGLGIFFAVGAAVGLWRAKSFGQLVVFAPWLLAAHVFVGLGSLNAQGVGAAMAFATGYPFVSALLVVASRLIVDRIGNGGLIGLRGLAGPMPKLSFAFAIALLTTAGTPLLPMGWGSLGAVFGLITKSAWFLPLLAAALVLCVTASVRWVGALLVGQTPSSWKSDPKLEPFAQVPPDLRWGEILPLRVASWSLILLGVWPRPWLALIERTALDCGAFLSPPGPEQVARLVMSWFVG